MMRGLLPLALLVMAAGLAALMISFGIEPGVAAGYGLAFAIGMTWALWPRKSDEADL